MIVEEANNMFRELEEKKEIVDKRFEKPVFGVVGKKVTLIHLSNLVIFDKYEI